MTKRFTFATVTLVASIVVTSARAALMTDGITRGQMTAPNPSLDAFAVSISANADGSPSPFDLTGIRFDATHVFIATHEHQSGIDPKQVFPGRDYVNASGIGVDIARIDDFPNGDFAILTLASALPAVQYDPRAKLCGMVIAGTQNSTIDFRFAKDDVIAFINQVAGTSIAMSDVLAGTSIIGAVPDGASVCSEGLGAWGTPATGLHNPDGKFGQFVALEDPTTLGLAQYSPAYYYDRLWDNDFSAGPLSGRGASLDSGSPSIIVVAPEPTSLLVAFPAMLLLTRRRTGRAPQ